MSKWIICASGPSMLRVDLAMLRRFRSWRMMVINNTWELIPWADVLYAGDGQWWDRYGNDVLGFSGERWTRDAGAAIRYKLHLARWTGGAGLCKTPGYIHLGGNSGYQAVNLAYHFGARRIILLGFDMHRDAGAHWHGEHVGLPISAPANHIPIWRANFGQLAHDLRHAGIDVVNATPGSALECFPRMDLKEALRT